MAAAVTADAPIRDRLNWPPDPDAYQAIRRLWIDHSKAEDARDLPGLIATLAEDCVYEIAPTGQRWAGHAGARAFYTSFLGAFPDVKFDLQDIVIGPQGVIEITRTAVRGPARRPPVGRSTRSSSFTFRGIQRSASSPANASTMTAARSTETQ